MRLFPQILFLLPLALTVVDGCPPIKNCYYTLYDFLFKTDSYKKEVRPSENLVDPIKVYTDFFLLSISEVDEKQQTLETSIKMRMIWDDDYLSWTPDSYGNITEMLVPQKNIYRPDIVLANSVKAQKLIGYDELPVRLQSDGTIEWEPTMLIGTDCDIDVTFFPFDTQICEIIFETAASRSTEIDLDVAQGVSAVNIDDYSMNGQWELVETKAENLSDENAKAKIKFTLVMKRRRTFYMINIIMPVFFLSLTASLIFALPAEEGEKMGTGITVLLAFAVYLSIVSEIVPNTSLQVSLLGAYLTVLLGMCAISVIICTLILRIHHRDPESPVGPTVTKIMDLLGRGLCIREAATYNKVEPSPRAEAREDPNAGIRLPSINSRGDEEDGAKKMPGDSRLGMNSPTPSATSTGPMTWQTVAYILDYLCFIFFSFLTILVTLVSLLYLHFGSMINAPSL